MANLGTLWFDTRLKDTAQKDAEKIKASLKKTLDDITVSPKLSNNFKAKLQAELNSFRPKVTVDITVNRASASKAVSDAISQANAGISPAQLRAVRSQAILTQMEDRHNESLLRQEKAHKKADAAASRHSRTVARLNAHLAQGVNVSGRLSTTMLGLYNIHLLQRFATQMVTIGGEFQKQRIALESMLGSLSKADAMYGRIKKLAVESPFTFGDLMSYTKQLEAFSIPYNELYDTTKRLADMSAGLGVDMGRLILAYGQVRSASFLRGQEVRQFTEAGIPLIEALAKRFELLEKREVSAGEVFERISKRQVSFQMVKDVLWEMTDKGGKFYNIQAKLVESLVGKLEKLKDTYQITIAEMAQNKSSFLGGGLDALTAMAKHLDTVVGLLTTATAAWAAYRVAVAIAAAAYGRGSAALSLLLGSLTKLPILLQRASLAWRMFDATTKATTIGLIAAAIASLVGVLWTFSSTTKTSADIQREMNKELQDAIDKEEQKDQAAQKHIRTMFDETKNIKQQENAYSELQKIYPSIFKNMSFEEAKRKGNIELLQMETDEVRKLRMEKIKEAMTSSRLKTQEAIEEYREMDDEYYVNNGYMAGKYIKKNETKRGRELIEIMRAGTKQLYKLLDEYNEIKDTTNKASKVRNEVWYQTAKQLAGDTEFAPKDTEVWEDYLDRIGKARNKAKSMLKDISTNAPYYNEHKNEASLLDQIWYAIGGSPDASGKSGGAGGSHTDKLLESAKERFTALKDFMQEYKKFANLYDKNKAIALTEELFPVFKGQGKNVVENYKNLLNQLLSIPQDTSARRQFSESVRKLISDLDVDAAKDEIDKALKEIEEYISRRSAQFDLYKSLYEKTGDRSFAKNAFANGKIWDDAAREFANKLQNMTVDDNIDWDMTDEQAKKHFKGIAGAYELWKKVVDLLRNNYVNALNESADAIQQILTIDDKIMKVEREINDLRTKGAKDGDPRLTAKQNELDNLLDEKFRQSSEYIQFYDAILTMTIKDAETVGLKIKQHLIRQLERGQISAKNFLTEFKRIEEQLEKLRDQKGDLFNLFTGGVNGYFKGKISRLNDEITKATADGDTKRADELEKQVLAAKKSLKMWEDASLVVEKIDGLVKGMKEAFDNIREMADALGFDTETNDWINMEGALNALSGFTSSISGALKSALSGDLGGVIGGTVGMFTKPITAIAKSHDKKLDKAIKRSEERVKSLQRAYSDMEKEIERNLGGIYSSSGYTEMLDNLKKQREELVAQQDAEARKKKTDSGKMADYDQQIKEMDDKIKHLAEDLAKSLYNIDVKSWAKELTDTIVDAWSKGEDAAEAYKNKVRDIVKDLTKNILSQKIVEKMMEPVLKVVTDEMIDTNGRLNENSIVKIASLLGDAETGVVTNLTNALELLKKQGIDLSSITSSGGGLTASMQSLTEETGNVLASYINAIRADVSMQRVSLMNIELLLPQVSVVSQAQLTQLTMIADSTAQTAANTAMIAEIYSLLNLARTDKSGALYVR